VVAQISLKFRSRNSAFESAVETIRSGVGRQFDPEVARVFLGIPADTWQTNARNQRQIASLSPELRRSYGIRRLGLGVIT
jgi:response regulator RpfG family c-di-GMP phosphodiesterase